ncbi:PLP-dependent aminotransferase family protein [Ectobacillus panaciterrae]|uniref:MocR-like pyridoxine biosynthesis transcription factor PdxR n=1 Tax=Ectobacillus panaciterrae TaxID=363872 RepID=UPI00041A1BEC|nr:PLP-dependent aminotransferase family protein [Ectobacillus panaciterrae]
MEFTFFLDQDIKLPLYIQLYEHIKTEIQLGRIKEGEKLPSIRNLAQVLQVSKQTIETAYQQLIAEGYVQSRPRSGIIVLPVEEKEPNLVRFSAVFASAPAEERNVLYDFKYGDIDVDLFPMKIWRQCINTALDGPARDILLYGPYQGNADLRDEIRKYVFRARGISCSAEQIFLFGGTQQSVSFLSRLLHLQDGNVAMENPGYEGVRSVFLHYNCNIIPISLEKDGICIDELQKIRAKAVYVTPSHQFPLGMVLPIGKRLQLLQWACDTSSFILEDDYDSEFRYIGKPIPSLKSLDKEERVVYCGTFSKCFLPAARISYVILPLSLVEQGKQHINHCSQAASPILQKALSIFMKEGYFERHIRRMKTLYQHKHKVLLQSIEQFMGDHVNVIGQRAGLHILLHIKNGDAAHLIKKAEEHGIQVYSPARHWLHQEEAPSAFVMLGFGGLSQENIREGIRLLALIWNFLEV